MLCLLLDAEEMQEHRGPRVWGHLHFLERAVDLGRDLLRAVALRDATVVPEDLQHRQVRRGTAVGETPAGEVHQPLPRQALAELIDEA